MTGNGGFSMPIKRLTGGCKWHRFTNMNQWSGCLKPGSSQRRFRIPLQGESQGGKPGLSASAARATGLPAWSFRDSSTGEHCDSIMSNCDLYHPKKLWLKHETCWFNQNSIKQKRWPKLGHIMGIFDQNIIWTGCAWNWGILSSPLKKG